MCKTQSQQHMFVKCTDIQHILKQPLGKSPRVVVSVEGRRGTEIVQEAVTFHYLLF